MEQLLTNEFQAIIESFERCKADTKANIELMSRLFLDMLAANPDAREILVARGHRLAFLESLERVGNGLLCAEYLLDGSPVATRAMEQCLKIEDQQKLLNNPVPVAIRENGNVKVINKRIEEISRQEASRLIRDGRILSPDEQTKIIETKVAMARTRERNRWAVHGDKIVFFADCEFTYSELVKLCEMIRPKAVDIAASIQKNQIARV